MLGFIGVTDVRIVRAEGTGMGPEVQAKALGAAQEHIGSLFLPAACRSPVPANDAVAVKPRVVSDALSELDGVLPSSQGGR